MVTRVAGGVQRWVLVVFVGGLLTCLAFAAGSTRAGQEPKKVWRYQAIEAQPTSIQATLDDLGRDGWEVFNVFSASRVSNDGEPKLVPYTFYVFARKPQ
jgi:hypothetical protein